MHVGCPFTWTIVLPVGPQDAAAGLLEVRGIGGETGATSASKTPHDLPPDVTPKHRFGSGVLGKLVGLAC